MLPLSDTYRPSKNWGTISKGPHSNRSKTYLSNILVSHPTDLLDVGRALRDILEIVAHEQQLVLDVLRGLDIDSVVHDNTANDLLAQEVSVPQL
jgi:hypothetical protein